MSSWKSYGGINNYENTNNITVDHLSANYFTFQMYISKTDRNDDFIEK